MPKDVEDSSITWWIVGGIMIPLLGIGGYAFYERFRKNRRTSKPVTKKASLIPMETARTREVPNWLNAFDMKYLNDVQKWVAPKQIQVLAPDKARRLAKKIKNSKGVFNDDEKTIAQIFGKQLSDKTQVASLSKAFWDLYKKDLWEHLNSFLSQKELHQYVTRPVNKLSNYTIK
ncbi:hypothetical protein [Aquimarina agarilytica]|uniref:hypothetical protein n=1 Tax=Aquimarina agarilytica TaxID=1087449 RepID=UPI0002895D47|nr:hypothetical protein [Aquimarina agarilytica]